MVTGLRPFIGRDKKDMIRNMELGLYKMSNELKLSIECLDFIN